MYSMPARSKGDGDYEIIPGFHMNDWLIEKCKVRVIVCIWEGNMLACSKCSMQQCAPIVAGACSAHAHHSPTPSSFSLPRRARTSC